MSRPSLQQKKLEHFFVVSHSKRTKKCFVYDTDLQQATFVFEPAATDRFLTVGGGVKLYLRETSARRAGHTTQADPTSQEEKQADPASQDEKEDPSPYTTSLLLSHLQKSIRRREEKRALSTTAVLLRRDKPAQLKLLRRLPVICIEDVAAVESIPAMVWLMMAENVYSLAPADEQLLLRTPAALCAASTAYPADRDTTPTPVTHEELQNEPRADLLLALHYRTQYGGMKGDLVMLQNAVRDYRRQEPILSLAPSDIPWPPSDVQLLSASVDFHPYPQLLDRLAARSSLDPQHIKEAIWFAESGINVRKPDTLRRSEAIKGGMDPELSGVWKTIAPYVDQARRGTSARRAGQDAPEWGHTTLAALASHKARSLCESALPFDPLRGTLAALASPLDPLSVALEASLSK